MGNEADPREREKKNLHLMMIIMTTPRFTFYTTCRYMWWLQEDPEASQSVSLIVRLS